MGRRAVPYPEPGGPPRVEGEANSPFTLFKGVFECLSVR
jgi:hypothetical protein